MSHNNNRGLRIAVRRGFGMRGNIRLSLAGGHVSELSSRDRANKNG